MKADQRLAELPSAARSTTWRRRRADVVVHGFPQWSRTCALFRRRATGSALAAHAGRSTASRSAPGVSDEAWDLLVAFWCSSMSMPEFFDASGFGWRWRWRVGERNGRLRLWDPAAPGDTGRDIGHHERFVAALASLRDGRLVSVGGDGALRLWDPAATDEQSRELGRGNGWVTSVSILPDGRLIAATGGSLTTFESTATHGGESSPSSG
jgi:hypothetical protein